MREQGCPGHDLAVLGVEALHGLVDRAQAHRIGPEDRSAAVTRVALPTAKNAISLADGYLVGEDATAAAISAATSFSIGLATLALVRGWIVPAVHHGSVE